MTLVTSLFNKGIYKNTLRRFKWGSFIYFIMLFFAVPFYYMVSYDIRFDYDINLTTQQNPLFTYGSFTFPLILAIIVPTVVALLVYNYVHSGKHSVFAHSLPITRISNYFSTVLAAFTLMLLPVLANGAILCIMTMFGYASILNISSVLYWIWVNFYIIFIMFSVATFASFLTGNSFAQVAINGIIHAILPLISLTIIIFSDVFLYGYMTSEFAFAERLIEYTPFVWIIGAFTNIRRVSDVFKGPAAWIYFAIACIFYLLTVLLCKKRRVENCGEVAGFKFMKPILKYTVTSIVAIASFGILMNADISQFWIWIVTAFLCMIAYFASEMILNKSFKIFGAYKGYIGFAVIGTAVICFFAFTSVFGFETRIPEYNDIESVSIYGDGTYHEDIPFSAEEGSKEVVVKYHKEFIKDIPVFSNYYQRRARVYEYSQNVYIIYNLKNGKTINRRYIVPVELCDKAISEMFKFNDYKTAYAALDRINIENVINMPLSVNLPRFNYSVALNEDARELLKAIKKDMEHITYAEYKENQPITFELSLDMSPEENDIAKVFKPHSENGRYYYNFSFTINNHFENAISYLEEKGYTDLLLDRMSDSAYVSKYALRFDESEKERVITVDDSKVITEKYESEMLLDWSKIDKEDAKNLLKKVLDNEDVFSSNNESKAVYLVIIADDMNNIYFGNQTILIPVDDMPEELKKYID